MDLKLGRRGAGPYGPALVWFVLVLALFVAPQATIAPVDAARAPAVMSPVAPAGVGPAAPRTTFQTYLPFVAKNEPVLTPLLIGTYAIGAGTYLDQSGINTYHLGLDSWAGLSRNAGKGHSIAGTFFGLQEACMACLPAILNNTWNNDYTMFINIDPDGLTAAQVASGSYDSAIQTWADYYLTWASQGGNRRAFLAPMPEMNWATSSVPWSGDPANYKAAYIRIQTIFGQRGVSRSQVWWVFAPNGFTSGSYTMSDYYPGDAYVDVVGFSSYMQTNSGTWSSPADVFSPYLTIIRSSVTSTKPIFVAQTGSCPNGGYKDQWIREAYPYLYEQSVRGVIYFNANQDCGWAVYHPEASIYSQGYKDAVSSSATRYLAPATLSTTTLAP